MNISKENTGDLLSVLKINIEESDYVNRVNDLLKDYRKKAEIKGFRKGMVPMGVIKKMYGTAVMVDEINKIVSESLTKYLVDEKINILGEPLPNETEQKPIDWENQTEFEFAFDLGISPEFEANISNEDTVPYYVISVDDKIIDSQINNYANSYGGLQPKEIVTEESVIKGEIAELDKDGQIVENGIHALDASVFVKVIKDDKIKEQFIGANINEIITFDLKKAFPSDAEIASMLNIDKKLVEKIDSDFQIIIKEISEHVPMEIGQDLFDMVFNDNSVKSEEEFRLKVKEKIAESLINDSNYRFQIDAKDYLINKYEFNLPVDFLKRWLDAVNEKLTREEIDRDWDGFEKDLRWQLIKSKIAKDNDINVNEEEIFAEAKLATMAHIQQYGMGYLPEDQIDSFARQLLENKEQVNQLEEKAYEGKILFLLRETFNLDKKEVSVDEFNKLFTPEPAIPTKEVEITDDSTEK